MKGCSFVLFSVILAYSGFGKAQIEKACLHPLGMESNKIPDSYLTATSSHAVDTGPRYARLWRDEGAGAWCPSGLIQPGTEKQYLTIRLVQPSFVARLATQGRYNHGDGKEFTKSYKVNYSRDGEDFFTWSNRKGVQILQGNDAKVNTPRYRSLNPGIAGAKYIRIIPMTNVARVACLRLELYGCKWESGLVSYDIPTPDDYLSIPPPSSSSSMFSDDTYDGKKTPSIFTGGLGQLSDGVIGDYDITKTRSRYPIAAVGYDFVGWTNAREGSREIPIVFSFDEPRDFTAISIYCSQTSAASARLFSLKILSSVDGRSFVDVPLPPNFRSNNEPAHNREAASLRSFTISLPNIIAKTMKLSFEFKPGRLLLSEIEFQNTVLTPALLDHYNTWIKNNGSNKKGITQTPNHDEGGANIGVIVGILLSIIVFLILLVIALYWRQRKLRKTSIPLSRSYQRRSNRSDHVASTHPGSNGIAIEVRPPAPIYQEIEGGLPAQDNLYLEPSDLVPKVSNPPHPFSDSLDEAACDLVVQIPPSMTSKDKEANGSHYAEADIFLPKLNAQPLQGVSGNNIYAVPLSTPSPRRFRRNNNKKTSTLPALHGCSKETTNRLIEERNELLEQDNCSLLSLGHSPKLGSLSFKEQEGNEGSILLHQSIGTLLSSLNLASRDLPPEFPRDRLEFVEKLGEGQFGEVQLCRADASIRDLDDDEDFVLPGPSDSSVLVAVKILRKGASSGAKEDFLKEVRIMGRLQDSNIVRLLAVSTKDEPFAMITEYMEHGDLNQYLQTFDDDVTPTPGKKIIKNESITKMASQIASGMKYLSSLKFVHRDLAARNCLVGTDFSIRIGDFGMSRNMYQSDYYRIQGRAVLPIRWMSWECILMGKFSSASDVWSFGVTLWEMFSLCKYQPHARLDDQQVITNMHHIYQKNNQQVYLPRPKRCPASMFNMIRQCWKREVMDRPTFQQLHSYLLEKQCSEKSSPKPKKPQSKPPVPAVRTKMSH